jgi:uncharacterized protein YydD (DUF2326 family)
MEKTELKKLEEFVDKKAEEYIKQYSVVSEGRMSKTLAGKIETFIKPLTASREDFLNDELSRAKVILTEVNKTWLGWLLLKRIEKKLSKKGRS